MRVDSWTVSRTGIIKADRGGSYCVCAVGWAVPALAYRPFDGTDAAVADLGEKLKAQSVQNINAVHATDNLVTDEIRENLNRRCAKPN
jgi:hypothetical protein